MFNAIITGTIYPLAKFVVVTDLVVIHVERQFSSLWFRIEKLS